MKTYFTAATSFNGELHVLYKQIVSLLIKHHISLISGKQIVDKKLLAQDKKISSQDIYKREQQLIHQADLVIAEASKPSLGVGSEITLALQLRKPVLVLVSTEYEDRISPMIAGNPSETLFLQYYNPENLKYKISDFISHVKSIQNRKGKLIVIDGGDGSGKTVQAKLLVSYFKKKKAPVKYMDFPQYYHSFHGKTVAKFLRGEFGQIDEVSPYLSSLAYALDRASAKREMDEFLASGGIIIANRYATSNMAHQSAKFSNETDKNEYLKWIYELEYKVHKIPKEDLVLYLHVPWRIGIQLSSQKNSQKYLKGKTDIAEKDSEHRAETEKMYISLSNKYKHWKTIQCINNNVLLSKEEIHKKILNIIEQSVLVR